MNRQLKEVSKCERNLFFVFIAKEKTYAGKCIGSFGSFANPVDG